MLFEGQHWLDGTEEGHSTPGHLLQYGLWYEVRRPSQKVHRSFIMLREWFRGFGYETLLICSQTINGWDADVAWTLKFRRLIQVSGEPILVRTDARGDSVSRKNCTSDYREMHNLQNPWPIKKLSVASEPCGCSLHDLLTTTVVHVSEFLLRSQVWSYSVMSKIWICLSLISLNALPTVRYAVS